MMYAILMHTLFLVCTLFVGALVGAVVWDGVSRVTQHLKEEVLDALNLVQVSRT